MAPLLFDVCSASSSAESEQNPSFAYLKAEQLSIAFECEKSALLATAASHLQEKSTWMFTQLESFAAELVQRDIKDTESPVVAADAATTSKATEKLSIRLAELEAELQAAKSSNADLQHRLVSYIRIC
jgi:hypothetical protein